MTVLEFLTDRGGYYSVAEIIHATGVSAAEAGKRLNGLMATGRVERRWYTPPAAGKGAASLSGKPIRQYRAVKS